MSVLAPPTVAISTGALSDDAWLGSLLNKPALRLDTHIDLNDPDVTAGLAAALRGPSMVTAEIATTDATTARWLSSMGFSVIDVRVELVRDGDFRHYVAPQVDRGRVRLADAEDEKAVARIAREAFRIDRFHLDPQITAEVADDVHEAWVRNYFAGSHGDAMVVLELERSVEGFLLVLVTPGAGTDVDLIAIDPAMHGYGFAAALIDFTAMFEARRFRANTSIGNIAAIRLYEKLGFRTASSYYVMHAHGGR